MTDIVDRKTRSRMMSGIKGKDTRPEILVRSLLHRAGFRFRLHVRDLPGKPDMVFPKYRAIIFIHGCFWHGHGCHLFKWPGSRVDFWRQKINRNMEKDKESLLGLAEGSWRVMVVWECALKGRARLPVDEIMTHAERFLIGNKSFLEVKGKHVA